MLMFLGDLVAIMIDMKKGSLDEGVVVHAGFPNAAEDGRFGSLSLDNLVVNHRASTFFWTLENAVDDLMWPAGSVVVVDRELDPKEGSHVVVAVDDDFLLGRFYKTGFVDLRGSKIYGSIWGVVTYCVQKVS